MCVSVYLIKLTYSLRYYLLSTIQVTICVIEKKYSNVTWYNCWFSWRYRFFCQAQCICICISIWVASWHIQESRPKCQFKLAWLLKLLCWLLRVWAVLWWMGCTCGSQRVCRSSSALLHYTGLISSSGFVSGLIPDWLSKHD